MSKEKFDAALAAMTEVVRSVLDGTEANRFAKASALCALTQKVAIHATPPRIGDVKNLVAPRWGNAIGYDAPLNENDMGEFIGQEMYPTPHTAQGEFQRQVLMAIQPLLATQRRSQETSELNSLTLAREELRRGGDHAAVAKLSTRINELIDAVAAPTKETLHADVVLAEPVRGHSTGVAGEGENEGDDLRAVAPGEGGDDGAHSGSGEAEGGRQVLAPARVPPFGSRLDQGAGAGARGTNLEGA